MRRLSIRLDPINGSSSPEVELSKHKSLSLIGSALLATCGLVAASAVVAARPADSSPGVVRTGAQDTSAQADDLGKVLTDQQQNAIAYAVATDQNEPVQTVGLRLVSSGFVSSLPATVEPPKTFTILAGTAADFANARQSSPNKLTTVTGLILGAHIEVDLTPSGVGELIVRRLSIDTDGKAEELSQGSAVRSLVPFPQSAPAPESSASNSPRASNTPSSSNEPSESGTSAPPEQPSTTSATLSSYRTRTGDSKRSAVSSSHRIRIPDAILAQVVVGWCAFTLWTPEVLTWPLLFIYTHDNTLCTEEAFDADSLNLLLETVVTEHNAVNDWLGEVFFGWVSSNELGDACVGIYPSTLRYYSTQSAHITPLVGYPLDYTVIGGPVAIPCWASPWD